MSFTEYAHRIENGRTCRNACVSCAETAPARRFEELVDALDAAVQDGAQAVFFAHHDLSQRADFTRILREVSRRGLRFGLSVTGRGLESPQAVRKLVRLGFCYAEIELAAGTSYAHFLTGGRDDFAQVFGAMQTLQEEGVELGVVLPVNHQSHGTLKQALALLQRLPRFPALHIVPACEGVYDREIAEALEFSGRLRGELPLRSVADLRFRTTGVSVDLDLARCPYKHGLSLADEPLRHALIRRATSRYEMIRVEGDVPLERLVDTKNIRSLLYEQREGAWYRLRLEETCVTCQRLVHCHASFVPDLEPVPVGFLSEPDGLLRDAFVLPHEAPRESIAKLRRRLALLAVGQRISVVGREPVGLLSEQAHVREWPEADLGLVADLARIHGLHLLDYRLSGVDAGPFWQVVWERRPLPPDTGERIAVFNVSSACVADCIMCGMSRLYAGRAVPGPAILPALEELKLCGFTAVDSFGGEITLRDDLLTLVRWMKRLGFYSMLITTGYRVDRARLDELAKAGLDKVTVALDSHIADVHDAIKNRAGLYDHALTAIRAAVAHPKLHVEVNSVILAENLRDLLPLHRFVADELGVRGHRMFYYTHPASGLVQPRWLDAQHARTFFSRIRPELMKLSAELGTMIDFCPPIEPGEGEAGGESFYQRISQGRYHDPLPCRAPEHELSITPEGEIYPCVSPTVIHRIPALGTLGHSRILDCLNGDVLTLWKREGGTWPECANCISKRTR